MKKQQYDIAKQHEKGKLHAIERIDLLLDKGSFFEIGSQISHHSTQLGMDQRIIPYDGVITGFGTMGNKRVAIYSQDFTALGGTLGKQHGEKIGNLIQKAIEMKCPVIGINDSGGARIQEGVDALAGYGKIFYHNTKASGYIPQISVIAGPCAGGAVYSPALTDFIYMIDEIANMFVTGPAVVKQALHQDVTVEQLGGSKMHAAKSGVIHFRSESEVDCYHRIRQLLALIPHCAENEGSKVSDQYIRKNQARIDRVIPEQAKTAYDMKSILLQLVDRHSFIEVQEEFAKNVIVGFAKISDCVVGIIANQPKVLAGVLDYDASDKVARFVQYCDAYRIPMVTLVDVPGFMPGLDQETKGIIRHGAKILYAYSEATVPKITVVIRKAFGGAYIAMCSKHLGADYVYAWPKAQIAVMGAEGAVDVIYRREIKAAADPTEAREDKISEYNEQFMTPTLAAKAGYVDEVIRPEFTRLMIYKSLKALQGKQTTERVNKIHGNMPL